VDSRGRGYLDNNNKTAVPFQGLGRGGRPEEIDDSCERSVYQASTPPLAQMAAYRKTPPLILSPVSC
jgi:hypothetical protein